MIKVTSISLNPETKKATVSLFADTKAEITGTLDIQGFPAGYEIDFGSSVMTASGELAFMKSDGTWNWT
jgi:hypothetical protein